ncbi:MAG: hypothetical protein JXA90_09275 [Planctomycetes bacterium]|nr:hypothetical protein [Planctomycetota bacterium]
MSAKHPRIVLSPVIVLALAVCLCVRGGMPAGERAPAAGGDRLPATAPLEIEGDIASLLVDGIDRFLLREIEEAARGRAALWNRDLSSPAALDASVEPRRRRLARILGVRDERRALEGFELAATTRCSARIATAEGYEVLRIRWPAVRGVHGEGLLLEPSGRSPIAGVVALGDADQTPEMLSGVEPGIPPISQLARRLAESGCRVVIPFLIDRASTFSTTMRGERRTRLTHREFLYRPAFELGRHIIGYEVQKVLAAVDELEGSAAEIGGRIGVFGHGEGGLVALHAAALDRRIAAAGVSGYFDRREEVWREPIDRNVFGLLREFGDAEIASLIAPRALVVEACAGPEFAVPPGTGGAPGRLTTPDPASVRRELARARELLAGLDPPPRFDLVLSGDGRGPFGSEDALAAFLDALVPGGGLAPAGEAPALEDEACGPSDRLLRQVREIEEDTQHLLRESAYVRDEFWKRADRASRSADAWSESVRWYRDYFAEEVIGRFDRELLDPSPRSRRVFDEPAYRGYEVVLDVFPDVIAFGILLVPRGIAAGERRPVVVCQHGLEGRPSHVADPSVDRPAYGRFACRLAERGFVAFAPQNPYIFGDRFRTLQRKANPIGKTLFSVITSQHDQITRWLASLPFVDPERIGFYGLSYGGKTAMRVPALVDRYCLSICSADFNEWIWKNASTRSRYTYVSTGEYEIFEFDLGSTFNYAEMAALIAPRPFMVERGHRDGVAPDEAVASEYAKVRLLYADLRIPERTEIELFDGPHAIRAEGTFRFLHRHLRWPEP